MGGTRRSEPLPKIFLSNNKQARVLLPARTCLFQDQDSLTSFAFDLFDQDHSGAIEVGAPTAVEDVVQRDSG